MCLNAFLGLQERRLGVLPDLAHACARLQVYQVISSASASLDNVVEFYARVNLPALPGGPSVEPIVTTLTLRHGLEVLQGSTVQITFEQTEVKATGARRLPNMSRLIFFFLFSLFFWGSGSIPSLCYVFGIIYWKV